MTKPTEDEWTGFGKVNGAIRDAETPRTPPMTKPTAEDEREGVWFIGRDGKLHKLGDHHKGRADMTCGDCKYWKASNHSMLVFGKPRPIAHCHVEPQRITRSGSDIACRHFSKGKAS